MNMIKKLIIIIIIKTTLNDVTSGIKPNIYVLSFIYCIITRVPGFQCSDID